MWLSLMLLSCLTAAGANAREFHVELVQTCQQPEQMAIIVNDNDPLSVKIGNYYREKRRIPAENVIHVRFPRDATTLPRALLKTVRAEVERQLPLRIQKPMLSPGPDPTGWIACPSPQLSHWVLTKSTAQPSAHGPVRAGISTRTVMPLLRITNCAWR